MTLDTIKDLIKKGDYDEALQKIASLPEGERVMGMVLKSDIFQQRGKYQEALGFAEDAVKESLAQKDRLVELEALSRLAFVLACLGQLDEGLRVVGTGERLLETMAATQENTRETEARLLNSKGGLYYCKGDLERAEEYYRESLMICEALGDRHGVANSYINLGNIYYQKGGLEQALEYHRKSIAIFEAIGNRFGIASSYRSLGYVYCSRGELEQASEHFRKGLAIHEAIGDRLGIASSYHNLGNVYRERGELEQASEHFRKGLAIREAMGDQLWIANSYHSLGIVCHDQCALEEARSWLERALTIFKSLGNDIWVAENVFGLFRIALDMRDGLSAKNWVTTLEDLATRTDNKKVILFHRVARALLLKQSKRARQKAQAQTSLEEIVNEEVVNHELTVLATRHLCELLLDELKTYGEAEVLDEVKALINKMYKLGQDQRSFAVVIDALVLRAKFALLEGKMTKATQLLDKAALTATEKGLTLLQKTVQRERQNLVTQLESWKDLVARNASMYERITHARLEEYIVEAERIVSMNR